MKEYMLLDNSRAIKALAHPLRIRLIEILSNDRASVGQLSHLLGLAHAQVFYHVKELEKHGLVELVDTRMVNGIQEKYYQAVARTFFLGQSLGSLPSDAVQAASSAVEHNLRQWRRHQVLAVDINALARQVVGDIIALKPGEKVIITGEHGVLDFCHALAVECRKAGGEGLVQAIDLAAMEQMLRETDLEHLKQTPPLTEALYRNCDYWIWFYPVVPEGFLAKVPREKLMAEKEAEDRLLNEYESGLKTILISFPLPALAQAYGMEYQPMYDSFWRGMAIANQQLASRGKQLKQALLSQPRHRLTCGRCWLEFQVVAGRPVIINDGRFHGGRDTLVMDLSLPGGQLLLAPREESVRGDLAIPVLEFRDSLLRDVRLKIEKGRVTAVNHPALQEYFATRPGMDQAGSIGFGLNPAIEAIAAPQVLAGRRWGNVQLFLGGNQHLGGAVDAPRALPLLLANYKLTTK